ncbi:MAG TPA: DUF1501 domain-containing protein [Planctomycetota bacterium]|nr:DUF1501 domain-containing protein [Planctomycetota bacterium]
MSCDCGDKKHLSRRRFLGAAGGGFLGFAAARQADLFGAPTLDLLLPQEGATRAAAKACIVVWLAGGPSHIDTFDPKPDRETSGGTKAIDTTADGVQVSQFLPTIGGQMKHASLIRSLTSREGSHERGRYLMHTGYAPTGTVIHPSMGAVTAMEVGDKSLDLPNFISIGQPTEGAGFLPPDFAPFVVDNPQAAKGGAVNIKNLAPAGNDDRRFRERMRLLLEQERDFARDRECEETGRHMSAYQKADRLMHTPLLKAFNLADEKEDLRKAYGDNRFGAGCLLARRLVDVGVKFVEVTLGGWDTHQENSTRVGQLCQSLDPGVGTLLRDLHDRRMLDSTLVVCMGEFGRTPKINANNGRDHYPRVFSALIAGGGIPGGRVIGSSDRDGVDIKDRPVMVGDLLATMYTTLGVDIKKQVISPLGRPLKFVDSGSPIKELLT